MDKEYLINKRIVVISEAILNNEATGMAQTLANLFDNYPAHRLLFCSPEKSSGKFKKIKTVPYLDALFNNRIFKRPGFRALRNRWFKRVNVPLAVKKILLFDPGMVLISNLAYDSCLITIELLKKKKLPLCVYLMDNISKEDKHTFDSLIEPLMLTANKHIFISKYMAEMSVSSYPEIKDWTVINNPVEEKEIATAPVVQATKKEMTFAYAGSLWQMHWDAVIVFATALKILRTNGINVSLVIYTQPHFYEANKQSFDDVEITYGGFYRFDLLKPHLLQHKALLVASSFEKKYYDLSAYSVQTKVTDYLACGVPVVGIGPAYSACNKFIKENNCGFVIESGDAALVAGEIERYVERNSTDVIGGAENGLTLIRKNYKKDFVQNKLYQFLSGADSN